MRRVRPPLGLICPGCGAELEPLGEGTRRGPSASLPRLRRDLQGPSTAEAAARTSPRPPSGGWPWRSGPATLRLVPIVYRLGVGVGTVAMIGLGGFVPVVRGWLGDEVNGLGG